MYKKTAAGNRSGFFVFILYIVKKQGIIRGITYNFSSFVLL